MKNLILVLLGFSIACSSERDPVAYSPPTDLTSGGCEPKLTRQCFGAAQCDGVQECLENGTWGDCACTICLPGSAEPCVGPGLCEGASECIADGSAWGACECLTDCGGAGGIGGAGGAAGVGGSGGF